MNQTQPSEIKSQQVFLSSLVDSISTSEDAINAEADPFFLLHNDKLFIKTKDGELISLKLNPIQKKILKVITDLQEQGKPTRLWILKARQEGVSTLSEAIIYALTSQKHNVNSLILADDLDGSNYLFEMTKLFHEQLEGDLKHELKRSNEKKLEFAGRHAQIFVDTADNLEAGRKYTFQYVHLSEVAYFRDAKTLMTGLNQAVPESPNTIIIGETTGNGVGGYFFDQWQKAKEHKTDWIPIFLAWFENPEYSMPVPKGFQLNNEGMVQGDDEQTVMNTYNLTLEQMAWRRHTIINKCDGDIDLFNQEYPANDIDAFIVSGNCRFNTSCLKKMQTISIHNGEQGRLLQVHKNVVFDQNNEKWLKIWHHPQRGERFVIGGDVAEGLEQGDYSTGEVINVATLEQCAEMRCHFEPDVFAEELARLGKYYSLYHPALMGVESNNHGLAVLQVLKKRYSPLFFMEQFEERTQTRRRKLGWHTSLKTKPLMVAEGDRVIREALALVHSPNLLSELMTYVRFADGTTGAQEGCFDDLVIAWLIALQMLKYAPRNAKEDDESQAEANREVDRAMSNIRGY